MSRIGRLPIAIPTGVTVDIAENNKVTVKGPKGTLERVLPVEMEIKKDGETITSGNMATGMYVQIQDENGNVVKDENGEDLIINIKMLKDAKIYSKSLTI